MSRAESKIINDIVSKMDEDDLLRLMKSMSVPDMIFYAYCFGYKEAINDLSDSIINTIDNYK